MSGLGGQWLNVQTSICLCRQGCHNICCARVVQIGMLVNEALLNLFSLKWNYHCPELRTSHLAERDHTKQSGVSYLGNSSGSKSLFALPVTSFSAPARVLLVNYMGIRGQLSSILAKWQFRHTGKRLDTSLFRWPAASEGSIWWSTTKAAGGCAGSCDSFMATLTATLTHLTGWEIEPSVLILKLARLVLLMINTNRLIQKVGENVYDLCKQN